MSGELKPITPARIAREIAKLSAERRNGDVKSEVYDQRFARMVQELRDRRIDGKREDVVAALKPLLDAGDITAQEYERLLRQIGMA
jgi:hypothetical protein